MSDDRSLGARLARMEACYARLEERANAAAEERKEWKAEVLRRLYENNANAAKLMEERTKDRAELVSLDLYNSRHSELKALADSSYRELNQKIDTLSQRFDQKMDEHDRADQVAHNEQNKAISVLNDWINNQRGRQWALGVGAALISGVVGFIIQIAFHVWSPK